MVHNRLNPIVGSMSSDGTYCTIKKLNLHSFLMFKLFFYYCIIRLKEITLIAGRSL